jgi:CubicO group peptidase (beta-lactamase class C family)
MINKFYLTLLPSLISICVFSQQPIQNISGKISDKENNPIESVTIRLQKNGTGTISNQSGFFKINIPQNLQQDTILFSSIGYILKKIAVSELRPDKTNLIQLASRKVVLEEVIVKPIDPIEIIQTAIKNIPNNYLNTPHITHGFYRMNTKKGNEHLSLSEAVFDIINYGYPADKRSNFNLIKNRYIKDEKGMYDLYYGVSPDQLYEADIIKEISSSDLLNKNGLKNHRFRLLQTIQYNNADTYVIGFDQKDDVKESLYKGKLYIDAESLAIVALDYRRSEKGIQYAKVGNASMRTLMKLMGVSIDINSENNFVSYQKLNGKWLLSNVKNNTLLHCKSKRKFYDFPAKIQLDYVLTGIDTANIQAFNKKETLGSKKVIEFQNSNVQADFWKDYNIILSDYNADSIAKNIIAKNESFNLKKQVEKKLKSFPKDKSVRIDSIISFFHQKGAFNGSVLIKKEGKIILSKGYGLADKVKNNSATDTTQYRIGSLTKTFTSLLIMQLIFENKLSFQDTVGKYLPTFVHKHITIQQLLTHTSGIPSYTNDMEKMLVVMRKEQSLKEIIASLCSEPLEFESGSQFHYSNSGYTILANIIEVITGKEYGQVLNEKIFIPLSMTQTTFGTNPTNSKGYFLGSIEPYYIIKNTAGAGGIISSVTDLLKWDEALKTDKLISQTILSQSFLPRAAYDDWDADYGFGWMIDKKMFGQSKSHKIIYHPGTDIGYYSMFVRQPDKDNLIIMLSNNGEFPRFDLTDLILDEIN